MNIFLKEMKAHSKAIIIWCLGMLFMIAGGMVKFGGYTAADKSMNDIVAAMPKALKIIFGFGSLDLSTASGYFGMLFLYILLIATIHAAMLGANIISKEERDKTSEFLFVKPVSRNKVITSKLLAALANIIILNIFSLITSIAVIGKYRTREDALITNTVTLMLGLFILQILFMCIGAAFAAVSKNPKTAVSVSTGIVLVSYFLSVITDLNTKLDVLKYITPYKYFEAKNIMYSSGLDSVSLILSTAIIAVCIYVIFTFYKKRDLTV